MEFSILSSGCRSLAIAQNGVQDWTYFDPAGRLELLSIMPGGATNTRGQLERLGIEVALHRNRIGQEEAPGRKAVHFPTDKAA